MRVEESTVIVRYPRLPHFDLETHITDVVNLVEYEDLHDVVLLEHSYAGLVVIGMADRIPERIFQLVYLDTRPLPDGATLIETSPLEARRNIERQIAESGDGWKIPMPPRQELANMGNLRPPRSRATPQPFGTFTQPLRLENPDREGLPKLGIVCSFSPNETGYEVRK